MVVYSYYPADARIKRAAEALAAGGMDVEVMCLRAEGDMPRDRINGVRVVRFNMRRKRAGKIQYIVNYALFTLMALRIAEGAIDLLFSSQILGTTRFIRNLGPRASSRFLGSAFNPAAVTRDDWR